MDSEIAQTTNNLTYEEARKKLAEVEVLFSHREPVLPKDTIKSIDKFGQAEMTFSAIVGSTIIAASAVIAPMAFTLGLSPLYALLFLLTPVPFLGWFLSFSYLRKPKSKLRKLLSKIFLTKKQRTLQQKLIVEIENYNEQYKIFKLFVQHKKDELEKLGVMKILTEGTRATYPVISEDGEISELTPQEWRVEENTTLNNNEKASLESLKELILANEDMVKSISRQ